MKANKQIQRVKLGKNKKKERRERSKTEIERRAGILAEFQTSDPRVRCHNQRRENKGKRRRVAKGKQKQGGTFSDETLEPEKKQRACIILVVAIHQAPEAWARESDIDRLLGEPSFPDKRRVTGILFNDNFVGSRSSGLLPPPSKNVCWRTQ